MFDDLITLIADEKEKANSIDLKEAVNTYSQTKRSVDIRLFKII